MIVDVATRCLVRAVTPAGSTTSGPPPAYPSVAPVAPRSGAVAAKRSGGPVRLRGVEERDVELGVEQHRHAVHQADPRAMRIVGGAGHDMGVGHQVPGATREPGARHLGRAGARGDPARWHRGAEPAIRCACRSVGCLHGGQWERVETDEHVGQPGDVEHAGDLADHLGRRRQELVNAADDHRLGGGARERRERVPPRAARRPAR